MIVSATGLRRLGFIAAASALFILPQEAFAKASCPAGFPSKAIRFVVGFGAGGGTDVIGRAVASGMERLQGWAVPVENKPGSGGGVVLEWLKQQAADGYTVGVTSTDATTVNPALTDVGYSYNDFDYLGSGMETWSGFAALKEKPFKNVQEFVEYARKNGRATVSVAGVNQEVSVKQLADQFKVNIVAIPGNGAAEAMATALGGHVDATMQGTLHVAQIKAGKMVQLASMINKRVPYAPDSGTFAEQGATAVSPLESHTMFLVPKGMNPEIRKCLVEAVDESTKTPEYKAQMDKFDNEALNLGPEGVLASIKKSAELYARELKKK
jgi:tripartite-type tricarboxylate transporter receptor subunit TctC